MLRVDNSNSLAYNPNVVYNTRSNKCKKQDKRPPCDAKSDYEIMNDFKRNNACQVYSCVPTKKCMAKVGQHDSNGNFLRQEYIGMNIKADMNVGGNQIGYVYQEKTLVDPAELLQARAENGDRKIHSIATLQALRNSEIYGSSTTWDGNHTGYFCVKCKPAPKPCSGPSVCKKSDPFNAPIGLGSDAIEARANLQDHNLGQVFREREQTPTKATEMENKETNPLPRGIFPTKARFKEEIVQATARREATDLPRGIFPTKARFKEEMVQAKAREEMVQAKSQTKPMKPMVPMKPMTPMLPSMMRRREEF